jgi:hypothetical protein
VAKKRDEIKLDPSVMLDKSRVALENDSIQLNVLILLSESNAALGEIVAALDTGIEETAEHLEQMQKLGLLEVVEDAPRRGKSEPRYRALVRPLIGNEEWATLNLEHRQRLATWTMQMINHDVGESLAAGCFASPLDAHTSRTVSLVDDRGWRELNRIQNEALEAIFAVQASSAERLAESGEEGFPTMSAMLCCELPPRSRRRRR